MQWDMINASLVFSLPAGEQDIFQLPTAGIYSKASLTSRTKERATERGSNDTMSTSVSHLTLLQNEIEKLQHIIRLSRI